MAREKQRQAAREDIKKAQSGAREKRTISKLSGKNRVIAARRPRT